MASIVDFAARTRDLGDIHRGWAIASSVVGLTLGGLVAVVPPQYGAALFATSIIPVAFILWSMPEPRHQPADHHAWLLLVGAVALSCIWPVYIALFLPGLPWIDLTRIFLAILLVRWLYCYANSTALREQVSERVRTSRVYAYLVLGLVASMVISIGFSNDTSDSLIQLFNYLISRIATVLTVVTLVNTRERALLLFKIVALGALFEVAMGFAEARYQHILWFDALPRGFADNNEVLQRVISGQERAGEYRVQGSFLVSLSYAEFLALSSPFTLFLALNARKAIPKFFYYGIYLATLPAIYLSGSRLGMVGYFVALVLSAGFFALRSWRSSRTSMFGPLLVILFPVLVVALGGAILSSNRLYVATIGGGQHQASNDGRDAQLEMTIPKLAARPLFGYGLGRGAEALGFTNLAGVLTVDNYVISVVLSIGLVGLFFFSGILFWAIVVGIRLYLWGRAPSSILGAPLAICLVAFCVIKWVLAQAENELLIFMAMGLVVCLNQMEAEWQARADAGGSND